MRCRAHLRLVLLAVSTDDPAGLDAASDLRKFGVVMCRWITASCRCLPTARLIRPAFEMRSRSSRRTADRALLAIDAPLGWPALGQSLAAHRAGQGIAVAQNTLFRRATDVSVHQRTGKLPLEVGADRIARAAWQALSVLQQLRAATGHDIPGWRGRPILRTGSLRSRSIRGHC